jgi:hypothetical protein
MSRMSAPWLRWISSPYEAVVTPDVMCPACSTPASVSAVIDKALRTWSEEYVLEVLSDPEAETIIAEAAAAGHSACTAWSRIEEVAEERAERELATA